MKYDGCDAITGGYVVRDQALGGLYGRYLYADHCDNPLRSLNLGLPRASDDRSEGLTVPNVSSFGEDADGRIYAASARSTGPSTGSRGGRLPQTTSALAR